MDLRQQGSPGRLDCDRRRGFDNAKSREGQQGALRIGPGGKALIKLRDKAESGKVELWVYDDGTTPENAKAARVGPRWGLLENDAKVLAAGILYNSYLGGDEGYTATLYDGKTWFNQLFWLGVNRTPRAGTSGPSTSIPRRACRSSTTARNSAPSIPPRSTCKGFTSIAIWGDQSGGREQTIWVSNVTRDAGRAGQGRCHRRRGRSLRRQGGGCRRGRQPARDALHQGQSAAHAEARRSAAVPSVSQYGITWTFDQPARVGRFVNGDWYVVGPVTVKAIDPQPLYGSEIPKFQLDHMDKERPEEAAGPQRLHGQSAGRDESGLRQRRAELVRSRAGAEAARRLEARRFAGLDDQHAQGPEVLHAPLWQQDRARAWTTAARSARPPC